MKTAGFRPALQSSRLLDQVRERIRYYSLRTEQSYVYWIRFFIHFSGVRHPRAMGVREVEAFLTHLASERKVSPATHRQALSALLFLYRQVLDVQLPWMQEIGRPQARQRLPVLLSRATTMIYTHVLKGAAAGVPSPRDSLGSAIGALHCAEPNGRRMPGMQRWVTAAPMAIYH